MIPGPLLSTQLGKMTWLTHALAQYISGYLVLGLLMMMLMLSVLYEIPELNIGFHFYMKSDADEEERQRLRASATSQGPKYTKQIDDDSATTSEYQGVPSFPRPPPRPPTSYQETDGGVPTQ